jgi:hypothetical protein
MYAPEGEESCSNLCTLLIRVKTLGAILTNEISSISFLSLLPSILLLLLRLNPDICDPEMGIWMSLLLLLSLISAVIGILFLFFRLFFKTSFSNFGILSAYDKLYAHQLKCKFMTFPTEKIYIYMYSCIYIYPHKNTTILKNKL